MQLFFGLLLAALVLVTINMQRAYASISLRELKRRARHEDEIAELLHRAAAYGYSLRAVLWILIGLSSAGFFVFVAQHISTWWAVLISAGLIWGGFIRASNHQVHSLTLWLAAQLAPVLSWLLLYLHPAIDLVVRFIQKYHPVTIHTGMYDKEDLLDS